MAKKPDHITITYNELDDRPFLTATGAFGGVSPDQKSVIAHLFVEHGTVPSIITHDIQADGTVNLQSGEGVKRSDITRSVVGTLVVSPDAALALGQFLIGHAQNALNERKRNG